MTFGRHAKVQKILDSEGSDLFSNDNEEVIWKFFYFTGRMQMGNVLWEERNNRFYREW